MGFRLLKREEMQRFLAFLSERLFYHIEWITILETVGVCGMHYRFYVLEKKGAGDYAAALFVSRKYASLYVSEGCEAHNSEILRALKGLLSFEELEYLYFNDGIDLNALRGEYDASIIDQYILSYEGLKSDVSNYDGLNSEKYGCEELRCERLNACEDTDIKEFLGLHRRCFKDALSQNAYRLLTDSGNVKPYYIKRGGRIVCKGEWIVNSRGIGYISGLCTDEAFRGRGCCSRLVKRMIEDIQECGKVALINCESQDLKEFYLHLGFVWKETRRRLWLKT